MLVCYFTNLLLLMENWNLVPKCGVTVVSWRSINTSLTAIPAYNWAESWNTYQSDCIANDIINSFIFYFFRADHHKKTRKFWWENGINHSLLQKFILYEAEFDRYVLLTEACLMVRFFITIQLHCIEL